MEQQFSYKSSQMELEKMYKESRDDFVRLRTRHEQIINEWAKNVKEASPEMLATVEGGLPEEISLQALVPALYVEDDIDIKEYHAQLYKANQYIQKWNEACQRFNLKSRDLLKQYRELTGK